MDLSLTVDPGVVILLGVLIGWLAHLEKRVDKLEKADARN